MWPRRRLRHRRDRLHHTVRRKLLDPRSVLRRRHLHYLVPVTRAPVPSLIVEHRLRHAHDHAAAAAAREPAVTLAVGKARCLGRKYQIEPEVARLAEVISSTRQ